MMDRVIPQPCGKKIKITCDGINHYSESEDYKNKPVKNTKSKYKDGLLLNRMLKLNELKYKNVEFL